MRAKPATAFILLPLLLLVLGNSSVPFTQVEILPGSTLRIDGTSTVNTFSCATSELSGRGTIEPISGRLNVSAGSFDCGIRRMNQDFREALKTDEHPFIRFAITGAEVIEPENREGWATVRAYGTLELAGVRRSITVIAQANRIEHNKAHLRGSHNLRMTHFGVTPPSGLFGMVRAHDDITVHFDLLVNGN